MVKDQCITVNDSDDIQGHASKYDVHRFDPTQPRGVLHRAFSVFLFDSQNRLLLQQRCPPPSLSPILPSHSSLLFFRLLQYIDRPGGGGGGGGRTTH